jgi:uncharacterized glyoxalase superfamily protein PhnB
MASSTASTVISTMGYEDAPAAIDFLQRAFGFEARMVVQDGEIVMAPEAQD